MLCKSLRGLRYSSILLGLSALMGAFFYLNLKTVSAAPSAADAEKQMQAVKAEIESGNSSPFLQKQYRMLANVISNCGMANRLTEPTVRAPFAPSSNLCINGSLAVTDQNYNRVLTTMTGTGIGTGVVGNCSLSGSGTATEYDVYTFNLASCAAFPTVVNVQLCGPAGCTAPGVVDTVLTLYRNVAAGDPLTANGGIPEVFNPASACTNARAANDDSGTTPTSTGGSTCNQLNTADCLAPCGTSTDLSEFKRSLGNGRFTIVVSGFGNTTVGDYNLYVDAPAAGCVVVLAPPAASASLGGRVVTSGGQGIPRASITISGETLAEPRSLRTSPFGYYNFENLEVGATYVIEIAAKRYTFNPSSRVISLNGSISDADFVSEQ